MQEMQIDLPCCDHVKVHTCYTSCIVGGGNTVEGVVAVYKGVEGCRRQRCRVDSSSVLNAVHRFRL